jgi:Domain of unknown function (DUF4382)
MNTKMGNLFRSSRFLLPAVTVVFLAAAALVLVQCSSSGSGSGMGAANVTMSDPPACTNNLSHVYLTVTDFRAHTSASAPPNAAGWQDLTPQLNLTSPKQIDMLNPNSSGVPQGIQCLLATELGSTRSLPAGSYQQFRLILADNGDTSVTLASNACASLGTAQNPVFNCVEDTSNNFFPIVLSSQDQTGLKIAPGQIMGGPITVAAGQSIDLNINLQACDSLVFQTQSNSYRLRPVLTAYQVSPNATGISGQVVVGTPVNSTTVTATSTPVPGAMIAVEVPGPANGAFSTDIPLGALMADGSGNFDFCPLPSPGTFDVVADGFAGGVAYDATIIQTVPNGTQLTVPVLAQTGNSTVSGTLTGPVTATTSSTNSASFSLDADVLALQQATSSLEFVVPALSGSTSNPVSFDCPMTASTLCTPAATTPLNNPYSLVVPVSAPLVGSFSNGTITYTVPASLSNTTAPTANFVVEANSAPPNSENTHSCSPVAAFSASNTVNAAASTAVLSLGLTGCQ